jgi:hypothetical protein
VPGADRPLAPEGKTCLFPGDYNPPTAAEIDRDNSRRVTMRKTLALALSALAFTACSTTQQASIKQVDRSTLR